MQIEGQNCVKFKDLLIKKKKQVLLSFSLYKQGASKTIEKVKRKDPVIVPGFSSSFDYKYVRKGKLTPEIRSIPATPKCMSKAPSRSKCRLSTFELEFAQKEMSPVQKTDGRTRKIKVIDSKSKFRGQTTQGPRWTTSQEVKLRNKTAEGKKITMNDLKVNLPAIVRPRRIRVKRGYFPGVLL